MLKRRWSYAVAIVVAAIAAVWGVRVLSHEPRSDAVVAVADIGLSGETPRATGAESPQPPSALPRPEPVPDSRFQLLNVVIPSVDGRERQPTASIAVDGLPPKTYRVGDKVVGAVVLQSVQPTSAALGPADGPAAVVLQLASPGQPQAVTDPRPVPAEIRPAIRAASSPPVNRAAVPVSDPDHGVDDSNH